MTTSKIEKVKRPPQTVMFAECKAHLGKVQIWLPAHNIIYSVCQQCGTKTSYNSSGVTCTHYASHYNLYQIEIKRGRGETLEAYWDRAKEEVLKDLQKYVYTVD